MMKKFYQNHALLQLLLWFNGITAAAGGIGLVSGNTNPPLVWLRDTPFDSYMLPGFILALIIGGSSLLAALLLWKKRESGYMAALLAGLLMIGWIIGELILLQHFSGLQIVYIASGLAVVSLSSKELSEMAM